MNLPLNTTEKMLLALLRMALHGRVEADIPWDKLPDVAWQQCYKLAARQGVMAMAWDGIQLIPGDCPLPRPLKLTWAMAVEQYEEKYRHYCSVADELSALYGQHGIRMVQLKGVGLSAIYPIPAHREGGDIDIYTWSANREKMTDVEANRLADELIRQMGVDVDTEHSAKHSNFYYKGVPIEGHKTFLNVTMYQVATPMNELLHQLLKPEVTALCNGEYMVNTPGKEFNALFLSFHAAQHYGKGIRLHHLMDWACLLMRYGWCLPAEVTDERLLRFIKALTTLSNQLLGTSIAVDSDVRMTEQLFAQMLHPRYDRAMPIKSKARVLWFKTRCFFHEHSLLSTVFKDASIGRAIVDSVIFHIRKPETIFEM